jgi:hypothetical protein
VFDDVPNQWAGRVACIGVCSYCDCFCFFRLRRASIANAGADWNPDSRPLDPVPDCRANGSGNASNADPNGGAKRNPDGNRRRAKGNGRMCKH